MELTRYHNCRTERRERKGQLSFLLVQFATTSTTSSPAPPALQGEKSVPEEELSSHGEPSVAVQSKKLPPHRDLGMENESNESKGLTPPIEAKTATAIARPPMGAPRIVGMFV